MNKLAAQIKNIAEYTIPWIVLAVLLFFTYIDFFQHPFGFDWVPDGTVVRVFVTQPAPTLKVGDHLIQVGSLTWDVFHSDLRKTFFEGVKPGEITPIIVERNGQTLTVPWKLPGFNPGELRNELFSQWSLSFLFWLAGMLAFIFLRPKDERWWLFLAFNFLTAIWLGAGSGLSNYHLAYGALILRLAIWLSLPIYLHFHWVFPRPLGKLPPLLVGFAYAATLGLMIAQWFQLFSANLYFLAFVLALLGSVILLIIHFFRQPDMRREVRLLGVLVLYSFLPLIVVGVAYALNVNVALISLIALVSFASIPFTYLYIAFRRQLGGLEMRANRIVSFYLFIVLLGSIAIPLFAIADRWLPSSDDTLIVASLGALIATGLSIWFFPRFQNFVEHHLLGISIPFDQIQRTYLTRVTDRVSINALTDLLKDNMLPSLLVRQFLFVYFEKDTPKVLLAAGIDAKQVEEEHELSKLSALKDINPNDYLKIKPYPWVRLMLPLKVGKDVLGLWLFGRRDPDDFYSQKELPILRSLASQTAIALSNILQTERLHVAFQDGIQRSDRARQELALELHDGVLNKMAALIMKLDDQSVTPEFQKKYNELTAQLREMVKELRPAMLNYGLKPALESCVDTLIDQSDGKVHVAMDLKSDGSRYPQDVEQHLFRIVQEACANALRHANPTEITISGYLMPDEIRLAVQDNGTGFDRNGKLDLNALQANNHFGLTGIFERAELIGAEIKIESESEKGTRIQVEWKPNKV
ncbi:MAG TPA: ATP-binding protein [Anaerolineales bacterium]